MWTSDVKEGLYSNGFSQLLVIRPVEPLSRKLMVQTIREVRALSEAADQLDEEAIEGIGGNSR
jgi:hypothetical protein